MCGICGKLNFDSEETVSEREIIQMRDAMIHRGPDDCGLFMKGPIGLGHRRLSIIDLEGGKQPIANEDGSVVVVYNGEIYNFKELRSDLDQRGHLFKTKSDTEVIVHLYEEKGPECINDFRGMFAFALWDEKKQSLLLARDRLGIKPLYYHDNSKFIVFASEIKGLLRCRGLVPELNEGGLARYLRYRFVYGKETLFKGIFELLPGHYMLVRSKGIMVKKYWDVPLSAKYEGDLGSLKDQMLAMLAESVRLRMISDVPIGVFLSGGVDSSAITGLMARTAPRIKTFSIGFNPQELNELQFSRAVAERFHADHHEYLIGAEDFFQLIKKLVWHHDEPLMFPASIPLYILSKHSKDNATVMLAGEGADEILAGYLSNVKAYWLDRFIRLIPSAIRGGLSNLPVTGRFKLIARKSNLPPEEMIASFFQLMEPEEIKEIFEWSSEKKARDESLIEEIGLEDMGDSFLEKLIYFQLKTYLVALLMKQDKMSMAASIETRVPFLDHRMVEFSWRLPDKFKIKGAQGKYILKKACESILPKEIIYRKKMGFPVPIVDWLRKEGNPFIEVLTDAGTRRDSFIKYRFIEKTVENFRKGNDRAADYLWTLLNLELWRREFLKETR